ncbi:uncharacterized protein LOC131226895 [Magnolia sinica]|uniref:uncharacterized protein LOC131226895 n=1 Tax=Magnolia sinica TaxID=86752 RepID=UPI00265A096F|nr:uncharacterized protein LOC131226895 [Magnolia sinica]
MAGGSISSSHSPLSIGNCKVEILGKDIYYESSPNQLLISVSDAAKIKISLDASIKYTFQKSCSDCLLKLRSEDGGGRDSPFVDCSFVLVNPKDIDSRSKSLLQDVLKLYMKELPAMNYAANTGKESLFLERCVSNGKYRTLVLKRNGIKGYKEVIAAVSYQIIPADTQYAEIPVAAVSSSYQDQGIGRFLYMELRKRLQNVGVLTLFCWGDKESEGFWVKQGFVSIAEVDSKGRVRKLPIKADIRRALCFPGGSTLMVSHLNKDHAVPAIPPKTAKLCSPVQPHAKSPSLIPDRTPELMKTSEYYVVVTSKEGALNPITNQIENSQPQGIQEDGSLAGEQKVNSFSSSPDRTEGCTDVVPLNGVDNRHVAIDLEVAENRCDAEATRCTCSRQSAKRRIWKASCSSLKSKKVKGGHHSDCHLESSWDLTNKNVHAEENRAAKINSTEDHPSEELSLKGERPVIMLMNIADDTKKTWLTKVISWHCLFYDFRVDLLQGVGAVDQGQSPDTSIVGNATSPNTTCWAWKKPQTESNNEIENVILTWESLQISRAWIISPNWLKVSFREGKFVGELPFILKDEDYMLRYRSELKDAVLKARASPCALFKGYDVCLAMHIQPPVRILSAVVKSAGGNVLRGLHEVKEPLKTIFVACEEDMDEALVAAKRGVWTFSSDWLMSCVMRQVLDFEAPQFSESL